MRSLSSSLLALALAVPLAHAQTDPPTVAAANAPAASRQPAPPATPALPALQGPETFTCGTAKKGEIALVPAALLFDPVAGFDLKTAPTIANGVCSSGKPFFFSIAVPEGNYRITVVLGGKQSSVVTVRAEARRLMLDKIHVAAGRSVARVFDVNLRVPEFTNPDGTPNRVRLKQREIGNLDWDNKLTLEFNGTNPSLRSLTIEPLTGAKAEPTIYLAGDSTVVDQDVEPWASWGQMLPRFFLPGVAISNNAESGETSASFVGEQRMPKVMSLIKPGDYLFLQFAHNDQKMNPRTHEAVVPLDKYKQLLTDFVDEARAKGATPVIVTAMNRDDFDAQGHIVDTLGGYPQAAREVAAATHAALIDLNAMSKTMFEAMTPEGANRAFMHFKVGSYPGVEHDIDDNTHFNNYGAYELARCIVQGIREDKLPLAKFLDPTIPTFNPDAPDAFATFSLPYTPMQKVEDTTQIPQANLK